MTSAPTLFDGATFSPARDGARLSSQFSRVLKLMTDGKWRTLAMIRGEVGGSEGGIGARLRDFRKQKFGGFVVELRRVRGADGLWEYRVRGKMG